MNLEKNKKIDENVKLDTSKDVLDLKNILSKKKNYKILVLDSFIKRLKEDKLYLISFIITILAITIFSSNKVRDANGMFNSNKNNNEVKEEVNEKIDEKLDVTNYVGTYVKSIKLEKSFAYEDNCEITKYDLVYQIKSDNSINKYFNSECTGNVLIDSDTLGYVMALNTKNIGTTSNIYLFNNNKLNEIDGYTYTKNNKYEIDEDINSLSSTNLIFHRDKFIIYGANYLYFINGEEIETEIVNSNSLLSKSIFRVGTTSDFKYIVYDKEETTTCYVPSLVIEVGFEDKESYSIYSISYDESISSFTEPKREVVRKRSDTCDTLNDDLASLSS